MEPVELALADRLGRARAPRRAAPPRLRDREGARRPTPSSAGSGPSAARSSTESLDHLLELRPRRAPRPSSPATQGPHRNVVRRDPGRAVARAALARQPVDHPRDVRTTLLVKLALRARRGDDLDATGAPPAGRLRISCTQDSGAVAAPRARRGPARAAMALPGERGDPPLPRERRPQRVGHAGTMPGSVPPVADEREGLLAYLAQQRDVIRVTAFGLTDEQARLTPTRRAR